MARRLGSRAYWDIATHSRKPEGADVLPACSLSVDPCDHHAPAPVEQTPSAGVGVVESGDGIGAVVCAECGQSVSGPGLGASAQHGAPAVAGILLRGQGQAGQAAPGAGRRNVLCPVVGLGPELVGRPSTRLSRGCDDVRATLCCVSGERTLSRLCDSSGVDGVTSDGETF